ncbi:MAG TPA: SDR family oxidoreductase [Burkholderiaceae bacterium]|nr:SDR family oxidoreductase [Burkholderiaceae bacterium]HQR69273.1 SDR family oxidoreductase [Burkholderiaceae bacterium]
MKVVITGGSGFLGQRLIRALVERGTLQRDGEPRAITGITALDTQRAAGEFSDPRVRYVQGDLADRAVVSEAMAGADSVFHLAAVVSGAAEADYDLGMRVNVDGTRALLDACRAQLAPPTFVFASSVAVFGGDLPDVVQDQTIPAPQSSYGVQKLVGELLMGDCTRRGFLDGRAVRLPTIVVRPGKPNAAASSFASGILREPLAGEEALCPVGPDTRLWVMSPAQAVRNLIHAHESPSVAWGRQRAVSLPGLTVSVREMLDALSKVGGEAAVQRVRFVPDERIAKIVYGWPARFDAARALALGFTADRDIESILRAYAQDHAREYLR